MRSLFDYLLRASEQRYLAKTAANDCCKVDVTRGGTRPDVTWPGPALSVVVDWDRMSTRR